MYFVCSLINFKKYWFSSFSGQHVIKSIPFKILQKIPFQNVNSKLITTNYIKGVVLKNQKDWVCK